MINWFFDNVHSFKSLYNDSNTNENSGDFLLLLDFEIG